MALRVDHLAARVTADFRQLHGAILQRPGQPLQRHEGADVSLDIHRSLSVDSCRTLPESDSYVKR